MTIKDIARICGCSTSTVSRAINDDSGINKNTKERILRVVEESGFVPNNSARNLKIIESNTIALMIKGIANPFFQGMFNIFEQELNELEYSFIVHEVGEEQDEVAAAIQLTQEKKLKGIIFLGGLVETPEEERRRIKVPYVRCTSAIYGNNQNWGGSSVAIDDEKESFRIVDYLCRMGHKRIAIITTPVTDQSVGKLRLDGYRRALETNGILIDTNLIRRLKKGQREFSIAAGYEAAKELLESGEDFTALYVISDMMAFGAYKAIQETGKKIPADYSVIGFDGIEMGAYYHPSLTTLEQPVKEMVTASIDQLMKAIKGKPYEKKTIFEGELVERHSVRRIEKD